MKKLWSDEAWSDYLYWQANNMKIANKIVNLLKSIEREGVMKGLGKPEPLRYMNGCSRYSRRITETDRLTYDIENGILYIYSCRGHYED